MTFSSLSKRKSKTTSEHKHTLISGKYGLRNHFLPLESHFLMRNSEKKGPNSNPLICRFRFRWNPFVFIFLWTKIKKNSSLWIISLLMHFLHPCVELYLLSTTNHSSFRPKSPRIAKKTGRSIAVYSIFIGPESYYCLPLSLTNWLTH